MVTKKATKKKQAVISSSQICTEVQKSYWGLDDFLFSDECPKYAFFPAA